MMALGEPPVGEEAPRGEGILPSHAPRGAFLKGNDGHTPKGAVHLVRSGEGQQDAPLGCRHTVGACVAFAREKLSRVDADALTTAALGVSRAHLLAFPERAVGNADSFRLVDWVERRVRGEPVAYIIGRREFWGLELAVDARVLIPRADTETLVEAALERIGDGGSVLDLGTGSGCVALAIKRERPGARVLATDIDPACLEVARHNAEALGPDVETRLADAFCGVAETFDAVVTNPPYVEADDPHLGQGDLRFEPRHALVGGLATIAGIVRDAPKHLHPGGWFVLEHGFDQAREVAAMFDSAGLQEIACIQDLAGHDRVTCGRAAP